MSIITGDTGRISEGTIKTITFTPIVKSSFQTSVTLPTTKPTTGQFTYNIDSSSIPTVSVPYTSMRIVPDISAGGQNTSGTSVTISYEILRNGVSIASGTSGSIPNSQYWVFCHYKENYSWQTTIGDSFELRLYASTTGVTLDFQMLITYPARVNLGYPNNVILKDCTLNTNAVPIQVNPNNNVPIKSQWTGTTYFYPTINTYNMSYGPSTYFPSIYPSNNPYYLGDCQGGLNFTTVGFTNNASSYFGYFTNYLQSMTFREVRL